MEYVMKGKILDYSIQESSGLISGEDGNRYKFSNSEWKADKAPKVNQKVDFEADGDEAKGIYLDSSNIQFDTDGMKDKISNMSDSDFVQNGPLSYYILAFKKYFDFSGRATRSEYWWFILFSTIASIILSILDGVFGTYDAQMGTGLLSGIYSLAVIIPSIAVAARRLHDIGKSGWWQLLLIIPIVGVIILIIWLATDSKEDNKYGPNPKAVMQ
jgi:uncharacterized membrane protein YhaH (DUF805 family)